MNKSDRVKFITANDEQGKLILEYLNKTCQQALNYCKNNNLQSYEDFAQTIKVIGDKNAEAKGEHLSIRVGIKKDDLVLSLANRPKSGATKSIKMLEHLGNQEKYQYTRPKVEELLQKNKIEINSEFNSQELSDFSSSINDEDNLIEQKSKNSHLDHLDSIEEETILGETKITEDLLFETEETNNNERDLIDELLDDSIEEEKVNSGKNNLSNNDKKKQKSSTENKSNIATKKSTTKPSIANRGSKTLMALAHKADIYTQDTDGMTMIAASLKMGAVGVALANKLLENKEEKNLKKTIDRILAIQAKSDQVIERSKSLETKANQDKSETSNEDLDFDSELDIEEEITSDNQLHVDENLNFDDESDVNERIPPDNELDEDEDLNFGDELDLEKDISRQLGKAVNTIDKQIQNIDPDISTEPIVIDQNADFDKQLEQINAALDRLEQKLDSLEKRIERLEQSLNNQQESINDYVEIDSEDNSDICNEDDVDGQNEKAEELDSEDNSDIWHEDDVDEQNKKAEELDNNLVNTLLETSVKYQQIDPDSTSGIPIGDNCQLCANHNGTTTVLTIKEQNEEEVSEIFRTTLDYDTSQYFIDKDELSTEEKQGIVEGFSQKLEEIDAFLAQRQKQTQSNNNQSKRQKQMNLA